MTYYIPVLENGRSDIHTVKTIAEARKDAVKWIEYAKKEMGGIPFGPSARIYGPRMKLIGTVANSGGDYTWYPAPSAENPHPDRVPIDKSGAVVKKHQKGVLNMYYIDYPPGHKNFKTLTAACAYAVKLINDTLGQPIPIHRNKDGKDAIAGFVRYTLSYGYVYSASKGNEGYEDIMIHKNGTPRRS